MTASYTNRPAHLGAVAHVLLDAPVVADAKLLVGTFGDPVGEIGLVRLERGDSGRPARAPLRAVRRSIGQLGPDFVPLNALSTL